MKLMQRFTDAIRSSFNTSTTDGIVGQLNRTINRLEKHSAKLAVKADDYHDVADALRDRAFSMTSESERAANIAANLGKPLGR